MNVKMQLPKFEAMFDLVDEIERLSREVGLLDIEIKFEETKIMKRASTDESLRVSGKPLATNYIEATYKYSGFEGELIPKRRELVTKQATLRKKELAFQLLKMQVDVYRTESANNRMIT